MWWRWEMDNSMDSIYQAAMRNFRRHQREESLSQYVIPSPTYTTDTSLGINVTSAFDNINDDSMWYVNEPSYNTNVAYQWSDGSTHAASSPPPDDKEYLRDRSFGDFLDDVYDSESV